MGLNEALISMANGYIMCHNYVSLPDIRGRLLKDLKDYMRKSERLMKEWYGVNLYGVELARAVIERAKNERGILV
jgi:hypothetical protein